MSENIRLTRQVVSYGVIGGLQIGVDWLCFVGLSALGLGAGSANICGRVCGALLGYTLNGVVTFRGPEGGKLGWTRFGRFAMSWAVMTCLSTLAIRYIVGAFGLHWAWLLKPAIDVVLAALGFLASRQWIYK